MEQNYRFDFYLIWNHGLNFLDDIRNIIKENKYLTIINEFEKDVENIPKFIDKLYALDHQNRLHIKGKTRYLLKQKTIVHVFILKNISKTPLESINKTKWEIREKYNPRFDDPKKQPNPVLAPGITHHHVIHGSDTQEETEHMMKYWNMELH